MTKRSCGVWKTRCSAIVNSTTPRFGPRCPPVCESTLTSSSRTSWASCGKSCSRSALISAGERIPSSRRAVAVVSEKSDFIILAFGFIHRFGWRCNLRCRFEIFYKGFSCAVPSNDVDLLFGADEAFLTNFHKVHSFFVTDNQFFQRKFSRFHLFDNRLEPVHRAFKIQFRTRLFWLAAHGWVRN